MVEVKTLVGELVYSDELKKEQCDRIAKALYKKWEAEETASQSAYEAFCAAHEYTVMATDAGQGSSQRYSRFNMKVIAEGKQGVRLQCMDPNGQGIQIDMDWDTLINGLKRGTIRLGPKAHIPIQPHKDVIERLTQQNYRIESFLRAQQAKSRVNPVTPKTAREASR